MVIFEVVEPFQLFKERALNFALVSVGAGGWRHGHPGVG
jgi:hypothetical protein